MRALSQRINRVLADRGEILKKARGQHAVEDCGDWFVLDTRRNAVANKHVDPKALGATLGLIKPFEVVWD
jgi:hypothetical protein